MTDSQQHFTDQAEPWFRAVVFPDRNSNEEREFRAYYQHRTLAIARVAVLIAILLVIAVCVLDWIVMPAEFAWPAILFRGSTMLAALIAVLTLSLLRPEDPRLPYAFMCAGAFNGVGTIVVGGIAARSGIDFVLWGTIFATFYVYLVFGLRFRLAALAGWPLLITFLSMSILVDKPFVKVAYGTLFLFFTNVVGMYTSYLLERDARELFEKEKQLEMLARTDGLTGIDNRRSFDEHLASVWQQARREAQKVAVLLVDIDHFKLFNDCYGHGPGDQCIQVVAETLQSSVNRPLDQVARYGGEEFAVVLYDPSDAFVRDLADEIVRRVEALEVEHKASDISSNVTVSVGAAIMQPDEHRQSDILVRSADDALYEAKANGRNRAAVFYLDEQLKATRTFRAIAL